MPDLYANALRGQSGHGIRRGLLIRAFRTLAPVFLVCMIVVAAGVGVSYGLSTIPAKPIVPPEITTIPPRPAKAITGSAFARITAEYSKSGRQAAALRELRRGNLPNFLRHLYPVKLGTDGVDGLTATIWVMPDYLSIGSDKNFLRIPLGYPAAAAIAKNFGFTLPTPKMVDAIYAQATCKLTPQPLPAGEKMCSNEFFLLHQSMIEAQLPGRRHDLLISGHKKDVVLTKKLLDHHGKVAIYGWHHPDATPIQPLSTIHEASYADYSHGIRLVSTTVMINDQPYSINEVLCNPALAPLLTYEGAFDNPEELRECELADSLQ